jgi:hypothetical protein
MSNVRVNGVIEIPTHKWYDVFDKLSRIDDLLEVLIKQVDYTNRLIERVLPTQPQPTAGVGLVLLDSTTTPLLARSMWLSTVDDDPMTGWIVGTVYSDAEGVLYVEQSPDGENWDDVTPFEVSPSLLKNSFGFSVEKVAQYARVRYVDMSDSGQRNFRLYVYAKKR